ncbi:MAG TPA: hypothetical protein VHY36_06915 [Steroidobacteraceae bacterium]|jgi:hypothetical protein|nr:hypothetical protein [Steroidobacteraceae bacterium]
MKFLRGGLMVGFFVTSLAVSSPQGMAATPSAANADGTPQLLTELKFETATPMATSALTSPVVGITKLSPPGWSFATVKGASLGVETSASPTMTGGDVNALEGSYPVPGAGSQFIMVDYNLASLQTEDIYIEFWAKMPGAKGGCKFVKIFGDRPTANNFADMTFFTNYNGGDYGSINEVIFGDGSILPNDGQHGINLNGNKPQGIGRSYGRANVLTPQMSAFTSADWGTQWHHFRIHVKFNSGTTATNEVPDGEVYLEIDGKVYVDATGLYNRNPANPPIHNIELFGWAQQDPQPFQLWYDDVRISTGGFLSEPLPDPPANVAASMPGSG